MKSAYSRTSRKSIIWKYISVFIAVSFSFTLKHRMNLDKIDEIKHMFYMRVIHNIIKLTFMSVTFATHSLIVSSLIVSNLVTVLQTNFESWSSLIII